MAGDSFLDYAQAMKRLTKIAIGVLLGLGLPISLLATERLLNRNTIPQDRLEAETALLLFGLPPTLAGGWLVYQGRRKGRKEQGDRLQATFFQLLQATGGQVTVLQFAMATGLPGKVAKGYLDERAKEFDATFNVTDGGTVSYCFDLEQTVPIPIPLISKNPS